MINKNEVRELIVDSPIEFVLVGTYLNERVILARSRKYNIDLLSDISIHNRKTNNVSKFFFVNSTPRVNHINSRLVRKSGMDRQDTLKFSWRGICNSEDFSKIQEILDMSTPLIYLDTYKGRLDNNLKWILADLVYIANEANKHSQSVSKKRKLINISFALVYIIFAIFFLIYTSIKL
ncbi:hypothetical protein [Acinetobacter towneri]|uniref:hypothetical protein n=1 Tax=Acinetobacter towneri TaxID=202956 RepID=UPI003A8C0231